MVIIWLMMINNITHIEFPSFTQLAQAQGPKELVAHPITSQGDIPIVCISNTNSH